MSLLDNGAAALAVGLTKDSTSDDSSRSPSEEKTDDYERKYKALNRKYKQLKRKHRETVEQQLKNAQNEIQVLKMRVAELERNAKSNEFDTDAYDIFPSTIAKSSKTGSDNNVDSSADELMSKFLPYKLTL